MRYHLKIIIILTLLTLTTLTAHAQDDITPHCPVAGVQPRAAEFPESGIILTTFDKSAIWVYQIDNQRRYPLPVTFPCNKNCHLSPDGQWFSYFNDITNAYNRMRIDGTQRALLSEYAGDVQWWNSETLLIWTPGHDAYLRPANDPASEREYLNVEGIVSIQPNGRWGLHLQHDEDTFSRELINLELRDIPTAGNQPIALGEDVPYFNSAAWSPDGAWLAFVSPTERDGVKGAELYGIQPAIGNTPTQWSNFYAEYGAVRVNGLTSGELSWSPDGQKLAFWVTPLTGNDPLVDVSDATLHVYDLEAAAMTAYCGFSTTQNTPNPPRLVWSPSGAHIAFGSPVTGSAEGHVLIALNLESGIYTALSHGVTPNFGAPDVIAWGN